MFLIDLALSAVGFFFGRWLLLGEKTVTEHALKYLLLFDAFLVFFFFMYDLYQSKTAEVFGSAISVTLSVLFAEILAFLTSFALKWQMFQLRVWTGVVGILWLFLIAWRILAAVCQKHFGEKKKCLIVESMHSTSRLARKIKYSPITGREAIYIMIDEENKEEVDALVEEKLAAYDLIFISPAISGDLTHRIMNKAFILGKELSVLADLNSVSTLHGTVYQIDDTPVIEKKGVYLSPGQRFFKRAFDISFALVMLILFSPVFLVCAVAIKLDSKGPVFYKQKRYTIHKKVFSVYKFRTMVADAEKNGAQFASENDPRITKVGKILRATRLDELPQILNILSGSMSVVGPRPERPIFADEFSRLVRDYDMRYTVKAGLTGYAQIYGKYNTRVSDKILMDIIYIVNYSFLLDIKIILLTGKTMFVKSATEGFDEEKEAMLSNVINEERRRTETKHIMGETTHDDNRHHTGV